MTTDGKDSGNTPTEAHGDVVRRDLPVLHHDVVPPGRPGGGHPRPGRHPERGTPGRGQGGPWPRRPPSGPLRQLARRRRQVRSRASPTSTRARRSAEIIKDRVPVTAQLAIMAIFLAVADGRSPSGSSGPTGRADGRTPRRLPRQVALSVPNFIIGIFLIWLFAVQLAWLPGIELEPAQRQGLWPEPQDRHHAGHRPGHDADGHLLPARAIGHDRHPAGELHPGRAEPRA